MTTRYYAKRVGFSTPSTGNTGNLAIGSRLGPSFKVPSETAIANTNRPLLLVQEGDDYMIVDATYNSAAGGSLTVNTVLESMIAGTFGTTRMTLLGNAEIRFLPPDDVDLAKLFARTDIDQASILDDTARAQARSNIAAEALGKTAPSNVQTGSYTLVLADVGKPVRMNVGSANNLTVPPNSSVAFPVDTYINVEQYGAGQTTIVAGSGVTIRVPSDLGLKMRKQYSMATLHKIATDEWILGGDITA